MNLLDSFARLALRLRIGRYAIASAEFVITVAAAVAFAGGAGRWAGALVIGAGGFELVRVRLARLSGHVTSVGALSEALIERVGEAVLCGGIALCFLRGGIAPERVTLAVMIVIAALALVLLAAYARARAEGLGVEARGGIPPLGARVVLLGVAPLVLGSGVRGELLLWMTLAFAVASAVTLVIRVIHVARVAAPGAARAPRQRDTLPSTRHMPRGDPLR
jgi:CDP-diacylglycerol--glycerol-3-phosphate 3-phosphatidyltransferase/CDP-diacylglycerol--inositol 3-phosphatidyltransferase